jgi:hypothetical protein
LLSKKAERWAKGRGATNEAEVVISLVYAQAGPAAGPSALHEKKSKKNQPFTSSTSRAAVRRTQANSSHPEVAPDGIRARPDPAAASSSTQPCLRKRRKKLLRFRFGKPRILRSEAQPASEAGRNQRAARRRVRYTRKQRASPTQRTPSMIPGFNHNIKHKGRIFHIQTEDSGPKNPHIITHLFVGGNILASKKTQYSDIVGQPDYEKTVRSMMEEQHKQMLRNLVNGVFDTVESAPSYHLDGPAPMNFTAVSPTTSSMAGDTAFKGMPSQAKPAAVDFARPAGGIDVTSSANRGTPPEVVTAQQNAAQQAAEQESASSTTQHDPNSLQAPGQKPTTIFGEDLISEKSLDEVILSYLAEDLADLE